MEALVKDQQDQILQAIGAKRWGHVEEAWLEVVESEPLPLSFHQPIIDKLIRKQQPQHFIKLYENTLDTLLDKSLGEQALALIDYILARDDKQDWLRERLITAIEFVYIDDFADRLEDFINRAQLREEDVPVAKAYRRFNDLLGARKGQVYYHRTWGVGVVRDLDMSQEKAVIDFETKKDQTMTLDGVRNFLRPIPRGHLQARLVVDRDELREMISSNAGQVIHLALDSYNGRVKVADLKKLLTTRFLSDAQYRSFWNNARKAIKVDPWIDQVGTGANSELVKRHTPRTFFDEIIANLVKADTPSARRDILREVRRHGSDADMSAEDRESLYHLFLKPLSDGKLTEPIDQLCHGLLFLEFDDLFEARDNPIDVDALLSGSDAVELVRELDLPESRRLALEKIAVLHPEHWPEMYAEVTLALDTRTVMWMEKVLHQSGHEHERQVALESILAKPDANPDLFIWAARTLLAGGWDHIGDSFPPAMICEELLSLLAELAGDFEHRDAQKANAARNTAGRIRNVLSDSNCALFKKAIAASTVEEARRILQMIRLHDAISHQLKHTLELIVIQHYTELKTISRIDEEEEKKKPAFHYTTHESLDRKRSELSRLLNEEIPGMAKVIQAAREMGDLRENSEYHAAKDRQKLLMQQAAELEELIARARVIEAREIEPDTSRFGTTVSLRECDSGTLRDVTLMGMWEADPERNIISYLTPFGSQIMGKRVGERFAVVRPDGTQSEYEVEDIRLALGQAEATS